MKAPLLLCALLVCGWAMAQDDAPRDLTPLGLLQLDRDQAGKRARLEGLRYRGWRKPLLLRRLRRTAYVARPKLICKT